MTEPSTRKPASTITCGGCDAVWTAPGACHCAGCHRTFSGLGLFDRHRTGYGEHGRCHDPATLTDRSGAPVGEFRNGMWRGPEMSDDVIAARRGAA